MSASEQPTFEELFEAMVAYNKEVALNTAVPQQLIDAPELELDDVLLAFVKYSPPQPVSTTPVTFTLRQRIRIKRNRLNRRIQQWIHDHLTEAYCDG